jgi:hypothetical protein
MIKSSFSTLVAELEAAPTPPMTTPRFHAVTQRGEEYLLDANQRPLYWRERRGHRGHPADLSWTPTTFVALRDLGDAKHDPQAAWELNEIMRRWMLSPAEQ